MSGCLDNLHCNCGVDWEGKRNAVASVAAGLLFFVGWWLMIDTAAMGHNWNNVYVIVGLVSTVAMFMVNAVSNSQVRGEAMNEGMLGIKGARLWLMIGFVLTFGSLVAAIWIMFADYVLNSSDQDSWPGVALFLQNFLIFLGSLVYKFGRTEELWG
uniref:Transmembrane protein 50A n=2 Tax=Plectus sambesii TaxID=2011161 RepID=A0A914UTB2_9BILA